MKKMFPESKIMAAGGTQRTFMEVLKFYNKMDALKALRDMFGYDKPSKHAHLIAGSGQGIDSKKIESAIIGLLGGTTPPPAA